MKCTPQNTIVDASVVGGDPRQREAVADVVGDVLDPGHLIVVGEDHRVARRRPAGAPRPPRPRRTSSGGRHVMDVDHFQREVERRRRMREPADREHARAGLDEGAQVLRAHAARHLQAHRIADARDRVAHPFGGRIVQQDPVGALRDRLVELVERLDLHLDRHALALCAADRLGDAAGDPHVCVLDQDRIRQRGTVEDATARGDRRPLHRAQTRQGLARAQDLRGSRDIDVGSRERGDPGQMPEQVQRRPFGPQHGRGACRRSTRRGRQARPRRRR